MNKHLPKIIAAAVVVVVAVAAVIAFTGGDESAASVDTSSNNEAAAADVDNNEIEETSADTSDTEADTADTSDTEADTADTSDTEADTADTTTSDTVAQNSADCAPSRLQRGWPDTNFCNNQIDFDSVISGGPGKDGIPAVNNPEMQTVEQAQEWLNPNSPVIAVEIDGDARAYPHAILMWHEIANDEIAGIPVAVTFCPLCNSSIIFDRRVDGQVLEFGVSGNLRNSDMIMFDRQTESWWQQFTGEGIVGDFNETLLDIIPSQVIGFGQFAERFPDGQVMSRETGFRRSYGSNPYTNYDSSSRPFLFRGDVDSRLPATERVLAGEIGGEPIAYPFSTLFEELVINDTVGGEDIVAFWQPGVASSLDRSVIDQSQDVGTANIYSRVVDGQTLTFIIENDQLVDEETGSTWNLFGEATSGELEGTQLQQKIAAPHFWFAWAAFHPETEVWGLE